MHNWRIFDSIASADAMQKADEKWATVAAEVQKRLIARQKGLCDTFRSDMSLWEKEEDVRAQKLKNKGRAKAQPTLQIIKYEINGA